MRVICFLIVLFTALGCSETSEESSTIHIETPEGNVSVSKSTVEPVSQKITIVTGEKLKRLESLSKQGPAFVAAYVADVPEPDLQDYDRAFHAWQTSEKKQHSNEEVIEILGGYLGNRCIADHDMEWVTVTDEYGTDYAIRSKTVEVMAFPFSTVLKRIEANEHDFLNGVYYAIKHTLASGEYKERETGASDE